MSDLIPQVSIPTGSRGAWRIERRTFGRDSLAAIRERNFAPGTFTQLWRGPTLVMSDTPAEMRDHVSFVRSATRHVLIAGLGIGMCLNAVLLRPAVTSVTVVELDADLIALVGPHYADQRVTIVQADVMTWQPPKGVRYGAAWFDIWDHISADNLPEMKTLSRRFGRRTDWHGCWARWQCESLERQNRAWSDATRRVRAMRA